MEKVWLSTTYYQDPKVAGLTADAERVLTRSWAYSGSAETRGFVPDSVLNQLGNRRGSRPVQELISAGLWTKTEGGYRIANWEIWQESGDKLLERRERDRERQRKRRELSRGTSRDVTPPEKSREEERAISHLPEAAHLSDARGRRDGALTPPVPPDGWALVRETVGPEHPAEVRAALAVKAADLLRQAVPRADVADALRLWLAKPHAGPGLLASLVSEAVKSRNAPPRTWASPSGPTAKSQAWLDIAHRYESLPDDPERTEITA